MFSALAVVTSLICSVIPKVAGFLSLDMKDAVIAIASFVYGPISAVLISLISALIEFITFSTTGWYGLIMNFASSCVFSLTASLIYKKLRSLNGALLSFIAAIIATTGVMLVLNRFVTPIYVYDFLGIMPPDAAKEYVIEILPTVLLPFNFAKTLLNSAMAMLLYKPVVTLLRKSGLTSGGKKITFNRSSIIIIVSGAVSLAVALLILLVIW